MAAPRRRSNNWTPGWRRLPSGMEKTVKKNTYAVDLQTELEFFGMMLRVVVQDAYVAEEFEELITRERKAGDDVIIYLRGKDDKNKLRLMITHFTEEELDLFLRSIWYAVELARPVVKARDAVAKEGLESGEGFLSRAIRSAPRFFVNPRARSTNPESVPDGSKNVLARDESAGDDRDESAGIAGSGLAEQPPSNHGPEDNNAQAHDDAQRGRGTEDSDASEVSNS